MNINLHIERLVVDGLEIAPGERHRLEPEIQAALMQQLRAGQWDGRVAPRPAVAVARAAPVQLASSPDATTLGGHVARVIHAELTTPSWRRP